MNLYKNILSVAISAAATVAIAQGQSVVTDPVGFITVSAKAGSASTPVTTFIGLSMARPAVYQSLVPSSGGAATVNGATVITFPANTFTAGQFGPGAGSVPNFYVEILNGAGAGILSEITATATGSITLADNVTSAITNGTTTFRIRPHWTFGAAFGTANEAGLLSGTAPASADIVNLINPLTGAATGYFFNTTSGHNRWEKTTDSNTDATNVPISPESGLQLARKGTTDLTFKLAGAVKTGPTALYVAGGTTGDTYNLVGNPYALDSVMLKDSNLYTGDATTGVAAGTSATTADIVRIYDFAHNQYNDYFFNNATNVNHWQTGLTDASLTVIPPGAGIAIIRRANRVAFDWYAPQPAMVLGDSPLQLALVSATIRRTHGSGFGDADINMPFVSGAIPGVDDRSGGTPKLVLKFNKQIISGSVTSQTSGITIGSSSVSGKELIVPLSSITDKTVATFSVGTITDSDSQTVSGQSITAKFLIGDVNVGKNVNVGDQQLVKNNLSQPLSLGNFQADVSVSGSINIADQQLVKNSLSNSVP